MNKLSVLIAVSAALAASTAARSEDIRKRYVQYVAQVFGLLGDKPDDARAHAQAVMELETGFAKA